MKFNYLTLHSKGTFLATLVLVSGIFLTFLVCRNVLVNKDLSRQALLRAIKDRFEENIDRSLGEVESFERSLTAFFSASHSVEKEEWDHFVNLTTANLLVPGIKGLTVAVLEDGQIHFEYTSFCENAAFKKLDESLWEAEPKAKSKLRFLVTDDPSEPGGQLLVTSIAFKDCMDRTKFAVLQIDLEVFFSSLWNNQGANASDCSVRISSKDRVLYSGLTQRKSNWVSLRDTHSFRGDLWNLEISAPVDYFSQLGESHISLRVLVGLLLSALAFALTRSLVLQNVEARERARKLSSGVAVRSRILEQTNKELRFFFEVVSDQLQRPLTDLRTKTDEVDQRASHLLEGTSREHLKKMANKVNVMDNLLSDLLAYTSIDTAGAEIERIDPKQLLSDLLPLVAWPDDGKFSIESEIQGFETKVSPLRQVLLNLVANAVRYRSEKPLEVRATVKRKGDFVEFEIADNGIGIDPSHHQSVFRMFHRLKQTQSEGTGVGLAIVDKVVSSAGGTLSLESTLGNGSAFRFTWPLSLADH